ncbi:MAG: GUN4 domain-containing protein [Xenococcus sp. (in: cyanobacteria)]
MISHEKETERAEQVVERFVRRFHESYRLLAYHAALPLVLTPELLNFLRVQFLQGQVPWVAEVDLLLSDLCKQVGYELYAMDTAVRAYLLKEMKHELGEGRMQKVARLLINYVKYLHQNNPYISPKELQAQQWAAMVFLEDKKEEVFQKIKQALQNCVSEAELARLTQITQELSPQLSNYPPLIKFAKSVRDLLLDLKPELTETTRQTITQLSQDLEIDLSKFPKFVDYLRKIFNRVKLTELLPYESAEDLDSVLDLISKRHLEGRDTSEEDVTELFHKPKGDDGTFYLLENLCLLGVIVMKASGNVTGTVRYALSPSYFNQNSPRPYPSPDGAEFDDRLQQLYPGQRDLLDLVRQRNERQQDTSLADAAPLFFTHPKRGDLATYRRLENLHLLGFLSITKVGTNQETLRYNLSPEYQKYLAYNQLRKFLAAGKWEEADAETAKLMLQVAGRKGQGWLSGEDLKNFPREDLRTINQLWLKYSNRKFGFSIQKEIYQSLGGTKEYNKEIWAQFGERIGWKRGDKWLSYSNLSYNLDAPLGHLPSGKLISENFTPPPGHFPAYAETRASENLTFSSLRYLLVLLTRSDLSSWKVFDFNSVNVDLRGREIKRETKTAQYFTEDLGNSVTLDMVLIPGGSFMMGTEVEEIERLCKTYDEQWFREEGPQHKVDIPNFIMGRYPITQAQWREVAVWGKVERELKPDPSRFKEDYEGIDRWTRPVENISWEDAKEFCNRLSKKTSREYRLPTEAEWEYACRAGTTTPFHFGETISTELANYRGTDKDIGDKFVPGNYRRGSKGIYREQTTPVGYFKVANNFGLGDMHGNVWEWCEDDWDENYEDAPTDGNAWSSVGGSKKVIRGGSWLNNPRSCRSAFRHNDSRVSRNYAFGFRVVCGVNSNHYQQLESYLKNGQWLEADRETYRLMIQTVGKEEEQWLTSEDLENFPCEDLRTINQLWLHYSDGKFGFSVQKETYDSLGGTKDNYHVWKKFCDDIGWRKEGIWQDYSELTFNIKAEIAHLPVLWVMGREGLHWVIKDRWWSLLGSALSLSQKDL